MDSYNGSSTSRLPRVNDLNLLDVAVDSEYDTSMGVDIPLCTQIYVLDYDRTFFLTHIWNKPSLEAQIAMLKAEFPGYEGVNLIMHFNRAELHGYRDFKDMLFDKNKGSFLIIRHTYSGLYRLNFADGPFYVQFTDTTHILQTSLERIGDLLNSPKLETHGHRELGDMLAWWLNKPGEMERYAIKDAVLTGVFYKRFKKICAELGLERGITSGATAEKGINELLLKKENEKRAQNLGYSKELRRNKSGKVVSRRLAFSPKLHNHINTYFGGRNEVYLHGLFPGQVTEWDFTGAYSGILSVMPEWDISKPPRKFTNARRLATYLRKYPFALGFVDIYFAFRRDVKYPSIPVTQNIRMIGESRSSEGLDFPLSGQATVTLQDFLASYDSLDLDATLIETAIVYEPLGQSIFAEYVARLRAAREKAKAEGDAFKSEIVKIIINSLYGKLAQSLSGDTSLSLEASHRLRGTDGAWEYHLQSEKIPRSRIFNPALAGMITGVMRGMLAEYLHFFDRNGIKVGHATTDSFTLLGHDLDERHRRGVGPMSRKMSQLLGAPIIEIKHRGSDYFAIKKRCYAFFEGDDPLVALSGVSLRGKSPREKVAFLKRELERLHQFKDTRYPLKRLPSPRDFIVHDADRTGIIELRGFNFDWDFRRRPVNIRTVNGILTHDTVPFESDDDVAQWRGYYGDWKHGRRELLDGKIRWTGHKNKLTSESELREFLEYVELRRRNFDSIKRVTGKTELRIAANAAFKLVRRSGGKHWGYKRIASALGEGRELVRKWVKGNPMSELELRDESTRSTLENLAGGALSALAGTPSGALSAPLVPESVVELAKVSLEAWSRLFDPQKNLDDTPDGGSDSDPGALNRRANRERRRKSGNLFRMR